MMPTRILVLLAAGASLAAAADPLLHASELAIQASERSRTCQHHDALQLLDTAIRVTAAVPGDTSATLLARLEAQHTDLDRHAREFQDARRDAERLLAAARVETADSRLAAFPDCAPELHAEIERRRAAARSWMDGASHAGVLQAPDYYRQAALEDCELPGLALALENARQSAAELPCRGCAIAKKVVLTVVIVGGTGVAAYYGYRYWDRHRQSNPAASH